MNRISILLSLFLFGFAGMAWGQECKVFVSPLNFGKYDALSHTPRDVTGKISVTCDKGIPFTVKLDQGGTSGRDFSQRQMQASGKKNSLQFNLYRDSARQEIWGDGTGNTFVVTGIGSGRAISLPIYGRIPAGQNVPAEHYLEKINIVLEY